MRLATLLRMQRVTRQDTLRATLLRMQRVTRQDMLRATLLRVLPAITPDTVLAVQRLRAVANQDTPTLASLTRCDNRHHLHHLHRRHQRQGCYAERGAP